MVDLLVLTVIVGAATAAISRLVAVERGPYNIFGRVRDAIHGSGIKGEAGMAVRCPICLSVWVAAILVALCALFPWIIPALAFPAAIGVAYAMIGLGNLWQGD